MPLPRSIIAADLAHVSEHAGVPVVYGTQHCFGTFVIDSLVDQIVDGIQITGIATVLRVPIDALTEVKQNTPITIDGEAYRVRDTSPNTQGRRLEIIVTKVPA